VQGCVGRDDRQVEAPAGVLGFSGADYGDKPQVPDDVVEHGERLASVVDEFRDAAGNPLAYRDDALAALTAALQAAAKEWGEAEAADKEYQQMFATVRELADGLQRDRVPPRRPGPADRVAWCEPRGSGGRRMACPGAHHGCRVAERRAQGAGPTTSRVAADGRRVTCCEDGGWRSEGMGAGMVRCRVAAR
jgi:hypothetical protein